VTGQDLLEWAFETISAPVFADTSPAGRSPRLRRPGRKHTSTRGPLPREELVQPGGRQLVVCGNPLTPLCAYSLGEL
jgi:hypothetical protein